MINFFIQSPLLMKKSDNFLNPQEPDCKNKTTREYDKKTNLDNPAKKISNTLYIQLS
jgi:hypothetical protein